MTKSRMIRGELPTPADVIERQREAIKEGTQRGFPEQLPRHSFFLHVSTIHTIQCSLSKLRKIKHLALMLCMPSIEFPSIPISLKGRKTVDFDIGTLALAFCYFERLVLYGVGLLQWIERST